MLDFSFDFFFEDLELFSRFRGWSRSVDFLFTPLPELESLLVTEMTLRMEGLCRGELQGDPSRLRPSISIGELFGDERGVELAEFVRATDKLEYELIC